MAEISTCCHHGVYILARAPISFNIFGLDFDEINSIFDCYDGTKNSLKVYLFHRFVRIILIFVSAYLSCFYSSHHTLFLVHFNIFIFRYFRLVSLDISYLTVL